MVKKTKRHTRRESNTGAELVGVRRITDGRLAPRGEAACLRSFNQGPTLSATLLHHTGQSPPRRPRQLVSLHAFVSSCGVLAGTCHLGPSVRTDWIMADNVRQRREVNAASSKKN